MKRQTRRQLVGLYRKWTKPCDGWGQPYSLGDHVRQVGQATRGDGSPSLGVLANTLGLPLSYIEAIDAALDEGISNEELRELTEVHVKRHKAGDAPKSHVKYKVS